MEAPSPTLTVGRQAMAKPRPHCTRANATSVETAWWPMIDPDQLMGRAMTDGLPDDMPEII